MSVMVSVAVSQVGMTELIFVNPVMKVNGQYYCDVLLSQQMLPAIKRVAERCLFTKQYVACGEIGHFLYSVIPPGKVVALDGWGGKWNHLSMTHRLTINCAKNYCNWTVIVKVIVENVVTCFLGTQCIGHFVRSFLRSDDSFKALNLWSMCCGCDCSPVIVTTSFICWRSIMKES